MLHIAGCPTVATVENATIPTGMTELTSLRNMEVGSGEILNLMKREEDQDLDLGVEVNISLGVTLTTIGLVNSSETTAGLNQEVPEEQETEEKMTE